MPCPATFVINTSQFCKCRFVGVAMCVCIVFILVSRILYVGRIHEFVKGGVRNFQIDNQRTLGGGGGGRVPEKAVCPAGL